jgi:hypothetical protein
VCGIGGNEILDFEKTKVLSLTFEFVHIAKDVQRDKLVESTTMG